MYTFLLAAIAVFTLFLSVTAGIAVYYLSRFHAFFDGVEVLKESALQEETQHVNDVMRPTLERMEKDREFDDRISRLKNELAMQQDVKERKGTEADVLHPSIQNLPHDEVSAQYDDYPVEVAE